MKKDAKIYVAGHTGLVGSTLLKTLHNNGYTNLIYRTQDELDLTDAGDTNHFFSTNKPEHVFIAAARVGGIMENKSYPADFIHDNLRIATNIIHSAYQHHTTKLLYLGSSCIYPRKCPQPMHEQYFMTGPLEPTNEAYAMSKISGIKMCQSYNKQYGTNFISVMPTNLYGPRDNFDLNSSHVIPAMVRKFHNAKVKNKSDVVVWGTGKPKREFLYVEDLSDALLFLMDNYDSSSIINVGTGEDISISDLAYLVKDVIGFDGRITFDTTKPDGMPRKWLDVSRLHQLGFHHKTDLKDGLSKTYQWYIKNESALTPQAHSAIQA